MSSAHIVINEDQTIFIPAGLKYLGVLTDHNVKTIIFDCPRYIEGIDISTWEMKINYQRADGYKDSYIADNVTVDKDDPNIIHFNWVISQNVTLVNGKVMFAFCATEKDSDGEMVRHWNTATNEKLSIQDGINCYEIEGLYPDLVESMREEIKKEVSTKAIDDGNGNITILNDDAATDDGNGNITLG